jgi:death-on-curing family protein
MPKYSDVIQEELYSVILRAFAWPDCNSKNNIISLVAKLFFNLIIGHFLKNGNKRFATSLMFYILYYFGYHFKWSTGEKKNYKEVEEKVIGFVQEWENRDRKISQSLSETMIKEKISEWIKKNIVIAIHK